MNKWLLFSLMPAGLAFAQAPVTAPLIAAISIEGIARVDGPVWLHVELPQSLVFFYPVIQVPWVFWCDGVEVRKDGRVLPPIDLPEIFVATFGTFGCPGGNGGFNGHPPPLSNRLPLHLQYRFTEPGVYEVRYTRYGDGKPKARPVRFQSAWTPILITPAEPHKIPAPPDGIEDLKRDFLPNLLADRSDEALAFLVTYLYYPDYFVRQYAANALHYWPDSVVDRQLEESLRTRGPVPAIAERFGSRATEFVETAVPYLASENPIILRGAVEIASRALSGSSTLAAQQRSAVEDKLISAIQRFRDFPAPAGIRAGEPDTVHGQTLIALIRPLGYAESSRIHAALWWLVEQDMGAGQALVEIVAHPDSQDLTRITNYMVAKLPGSSSMDGAAHVVHIYFGDAGVAALRTVMDKARSRLIREECAQELGLAGKDSR